MTDLPPVVSGLPAKKCNEADCCMCRTTFAECFSEWVCPHCSSHLSKEHKVCLNLCGLSYPAAQRFNEMVAQAARRVD